MSIALRNRALLIVGIALFAASFNWAYVHYLYPSWGFFGFDYSTPAPSYLLAAWLFTLLPGLWMPMSIRRPSQLAYWVLYFTVIVPSMFVPLYAGFSSPREVFLLELALFLGFGITGISYVLPLPRLPIPNLADRTFWKLFGWFAAGLTVWVLIAFRGSLAIVSFQDIYDIRNAASDLMEGTRLNYAVMWLYGAINPFMMGWGIYYRRKSAFAVGALGQVLVYSTMGTKASIISVVFISGFYFLLRKGRFPFAIKMSSATAALVVAVCVTCVRDDKSEGLLQAGLAYVVLMRTFGLSGLLTAQYRYFFQHNPFTYYSHVTGINWLVHYPFHYSLGTEIGYYYYNPLCDTTAHLYATDGLAALGLPGILIAGMLCAALFWLIDTTAQRHDTNFGALVISYAAYNLANLSMFTTTLSGGLGVLAVLLYVMPPRAAAPSRQRIRQHPTANENPGLGGLSSLPATEGL